MGWGATAWHDCSFWFGTHLGNSAILWLGPSVLTDRGTGKNCDRVAPRRGARPLIGLPPYIIVAATPVCSENRRGFGSANRPPRPDAIGCSRASTPEPSA